MSEALLTLLRWCLLALVYLFFFRVLQATWFSTGGNLRRVRTRPPAGAQRSAVGATRSARSAAPSLVCIEPAEVAGNVHPLTGTLTIGRAAGCDITLDDTFISQVHARVGIGESGVVIEDLGSTNGTYLNRKRVTAPVVVSPGDAIQVGSTIMELRS